MTSNLSVLFKKYSVPALFLIAGCVLLIMGIQKNQDQMFMIASILMFVAGGLSVIYSSGKLKPMMIMVFGALAAVAAIFTFFVSSRSVSDTVEYQENYKLCKSVAQQNLEDVRFIQKEYAKKHGKYLGSWDELVAFAKEGTVDYVISEGIVPSRKITVEERKFLYNDNRAIDVNMTEEEAYRLSKWPENPSADDKGNLYYETEFKNFKRDTIQVSLLKNKFMSKSYVANREKAGFGPFIADSLPYIPFTGGKEMWSLQVVDSVQMGDGTVPAMRVEGFIPFAEIKGKDNDQEEVYMGSLTSNDLSGSWEVE